jgi:phosphoribosylformylglycinamidine synthase subunit PurQ / glutaminase
MKFGIVQFPGSTNHKDLLYVIRDILEQEAFFIWHNESGLNKADALIIPGIGVNGLSEKASTSLINSPIMRHVEKFAKNGGFVFGIGTGFNLLCESGLLPGKISINGNRKFCCKNVYIKPSHVHSSITALLDTNLAYKIPIACLYGKFYIDDESVRGLRENKQILFHYCDKDGHLTEDADPGGSLANIAGICNREKNVYGLIPQPERASDDELGNTDGRAIFESIIAYLR